MGPGLRRDDDRGFANFPSRSEFLPGLFAFPLYGFWQTASIGYPSGSITKAA
jgi:hypothetical protein